MADFPSNPSLGDVFFSAEGVANGSNTIYWTWDGNSWKAEQFGTSNGNVSVSGTSTFPVSANSSSTVTANGINFVNTSTVTVTVTGGNSGNANISFAAASSSGIASFPVSANSGSTVTANGLNFVNTAHIQVSVGSGLTGNSNVSISTDLLDTNNLWEAGNSTNTANASIVSSQVTLDCSDSNVHKIDLTGSITLNAPINGKSGQVINIIFKQNSSGNWAVTFNSAFKFPGGLDPIITVSPNAVDVLTCQYDIHNSCWYCVISQDFA